MFIGSIFAGLFWGLRGQYFFASAAVLQLPLQPGLRDTQFTAYFFDRQLQNFSGLLGGQATKESHFNQLGFSRVLVLELTQRVIDRDHRQRPFHRRIPGFIERTAQLPAAAFSGITRARLIDQDLAHEVRSDAQEVRAAAIVGLILCDQADVRFVNQRGRLKRVTGPLVAQLAIGEAAQLGIDQRHQAIKRGLVASSELLQNKRDGLCPGQSSLGCISISSRSSRTNARCARRASAWDQILPFVFTGRAEYRWRGGLGHFALPPLLAVRGEIRAARLHSAKSNADRPGQERPSKFPTVFRTRRVTIVCLYQSMKIGRIAWADATGRHAQSRLGYPTYRRDLRAFCSPPVR